MARRGSTPGAADALERLVERDLTALARDGRLPPAFGVDATVDEVIALIAGGGKHPLLVGEVGVGKSAVVNEVARRIADGRAGEALNGRRLVEISFAGVFARTGNPRQAAERLEDLFDRLGSPRPAIVFVRDVAAARDTSLAPVFLRALRAGPLRFLAEAAAAAAQELLAGADALAESLHVCMVHEPSRERARWLLGQAAERIEAELGIDIDPAACGAALGLSTKFLVARRLPRKAIELLRETAAAAAAAGSERVGPEAVLERFCATTRLPRFLVDETAALDLAAMERHFAERLLGQSDAVAAVLRAVARFKTGLHDPRRPLGAFLFAGPTGVGKTHLAMLLAEYLFGSADRLVRLNMADYPEEGDESVVFGRPWGTTRAECRGDLARRLDDKVFAVLLLDELEKAHQDCHDRFLQLFDEGRFANAAGETVVCSNTLIIATTNVGADVYEEGGAVGFSGPRAALERKAEVDRRLGEAFRRELLNRFDAVCHFLPLGRVEIRKIAQREVGRVLEREGIQSRGLDVDVAPEVIDRLVERGYSPVWGARFLQREIERALTAALAVEIAQRPPPPGTRLGVVVGRGGQIAAQVEAPLAPPESPQRVALPAGGAAVARRKLDRAGLVAEAEQLVVRSRALDALFDRPGLESERAALVAATGAPDFWDDAGRAAEALRRFRSVEARLVDLDRVSAASAAALRRAREATTEAHLAGAARALEQAAREVQLAEARATAGQGPADEALLEICAVGESPAHAGWVGELLRMYRGWAERRGYEGRAVAEGERPARVVLRLAGPGVLGFLAGEEGAHRRVDGGERAAAWVRVHRESDGATASIAAVTRDERRRAGTYLDRVGGAVTARDDATGRELTLCGSEDVAALKALAAAVLAGQGGSLADARRYRLDRAPRVEDPRTGAGTPRVKDVLRGDIDLFLAAWVARPRG